MNILAVLEFGSTARGEADEYSDRDICIVIDKLTSTIDQVVEIGSNQVGINELEETEFIIYEDSALGHMLEKGSLFLWHIKLEGKVLLGEDYFSSKICMLKEFNNYEGKFEHYYSMYKDLEESIKIIPIITTFDFSVLFTIVRNLSILVCFKLRRPAFGREDAFIKVKDHYGDIGLNLQEYQNLLKCKLSYERGFNLIAHEKLDVLVYLKKVKDYIDFVKEKLHCER